MLKHHEIWLALDRLAAREKLSVSGLAVKAGLSPTIFNKSKRNHAGRPHWPSTESLAQVLQYTQTNLADFIALANDNPSQRRTIPLLGYAQAGRAGHFDDVGYPAGSNWDEIALPGINDPHAFALEVSGKSMEPVYRAGDRAVVAPSERVRRGDRVVLRTRKGEVMLKQLVRETASKVELLSLNPAYPPVILAHHDVLWLYRIVWVSQ